MVISPTPLLRREALYEQTYEALRGSILSGTLVPGARLVETRLAAELQVSRTPIREAMRQLQREGLVAADARGGMRVITVSVEDAVQLYDCRLALETLAVTAACAQAQAADLQALEQAVQRAEAAVQGADTWPDPLELLSLDHQFHQQIAESAGNPWLTNLLNQVFDKMMLLRIQTTRHNPKVLDICQEHRQIYMAIAQRESGVAIAAIQRHLEASKGRVVAAVKALQEM